MNKETENIIAQIKEFKVEMNDASGKDSGMMFPYERGQSRYWDVRQELVEYMMILDFDVIKGLKTLMYMGREYHMAYTIEGFRPEHYRGNITGQGIYDMVRTDLEDLKWENKGIEINHMVAKAPLGEYLEKGLEILIG